MNGCSGRDWLLATTIVRVRVVSLAENVYGFVKMAGESVHILKGCGKGARDRGELRESAAWSEVSRSWGPGVMSFDGEFCILLSCA